MGTYSERRVAYHEAGHAVMRFIKRLRITEVSILPDKETLGRCRGGKLPDSFRPDRDTSCRTQRRLEKMIVTKLAGNAAENILVGRRRRRTGSSGDLRRACDLADYLNGSAEQTAAYIKWQELCAEGTLRIWWFLVEALVEELLHSRRLNGRRAHGFLRKTFHEQAEEWFRKLSSKAVTFPPLSARKLDLNVELPPIREKAKLADGHPGGEAVIRP